MNIKTCLVLFIIFLFACESDNSNNDDIPDNINTGYFIDSPVSGLSYKTETLSGMTNDSGEFSFRHAETIQFSIGDTLLPVTAATNMVTPFDIFNTDDINHTGLVNLCRLLQSLDVDGDPSNGITIAQQAHLSATGLNIDFESTTFDIDVTNLVANSGSVNTQLISNYQAMSHLSTSLGLALDIILEDTESLTDGSLPEEPLPEEPLPEEPLAEEPLAEEPLPEEPVHINPYLYSTLSGPVSANINSYSIAFTFTLHNGSDVPFIYDFSCSATVTYTLYSPAGNTWNEPVNICLTVITPLYIAPGGYSSHWVYVDPGYLNLTPGYYVISVNLIDHPHISATAGFVLE